MRVERYRGRRTGRRSWLRYGCLGFIGLLIPLVAFVAIVVLPEYPDFIERVQSGEFAAEIEDSLQNLTLFQMINKETTMSYDMMEETAVAAGTEIMTTTPRVTLTPVEEAVSYRFEVEVDTMSGRELLGDAVQVNLGELGAQTLPTMSPMYGVTPVQFNDASGVRVNLNDSGLLQMCNVYSDICGETREDLRNIRFTVEPDSVVVTGDMFFIPLSIWQGLRFKILPDGVNRVRVEEFSVSGIQLPRSIGDIGSLIDEIEAQLNQLLQDAVIEADNGQYRLQEIFFEGSDLVLLLQ